MDATHKSSREELVVWKKTRERAGIETQTERRDLGTQQRKERVGQIQSSSKDRALPYAK